LHSNNSLRKMI